MQAGADGAPASTTGATGTQTGPGNEAQIASQSLPPELQQLFSSLSIEISQLTTDVSQLTADVSLLQSGLGLGQTGDNQLATTTASGTGSDVTSKNVPSDHADGGQNLSLFKSNFTENAPERTF